MIKAVFFDIDGTLVSFKTHRMPSSTVDALDRLRARGIRIFVASGRPRSLIDNLGDYPFDGYVTCNGSLVEVGDETVYCRPLALETAIRVVDVLEAQGRTALVFQEKGTLMNFLDDRAPVVGPVIQMPMPPVGDVRAAVRARKTCQISCYVTVGEEEVWGFSRMPGVAFQRWHPMILDLTADGVAKGIGAQAAIDRLGIRREEAMSFGDGGNDKDLLRWAGIGIAMGNAKDDVKAVADEVTEDVDSDGLARALARHGLLG